MDEHDMGPRDMGPQNMAHENMGPDEPAPEAAIAKTPVEHKLIDDNLIQDGARTQDGVSDFDDDEDAFSLEELGAAYKHIVAQSDSDDGEPPIQTGEVLQRDQLRAAQAKAEAEAAASAADDAEHVDADQSGEEPPWSSASDQPADEIATPDAIIESALFVGQPSGEPISATRLASIIRDMSPDEVIEIVERINASYREQRQGIRITQEDAGFRMIVAPEVESMRHAFTGKVRETRLNQSAIEVLSLVAYQPGISSQQCTDLRSRDSGPLLNQMVRRRLIEMRREPEFRDPPPSDVTRDDTQSESSSEETQSSPEKKKPAKKKSVKPKMVSRYYPAERLLVLLGLESLEDLPQVEETHLE